MLFFIGSHSIFKVEPIGDGNYKIIDIFYNIKPHLQIGKCYYFPSYRIVGSKPLVKLIFEKFNR